MTETKVENANDVTELQKDRFRQKIPGGTDHMTVGHIINFEESKKKKFFHKFANEPFF